MKKILKALATYFLVIAAVFLIFALFNRDEGFFTTYNIMSGLAYGGLLVFVIFGFVSKKGNHAIPATSMQMPVIFHAGFSGGLNAFIANLSFGRNELRIVQAAKPQFDTKKASIEMHADDDSLIVKIILILLPFVVGIGSMAVGIMWLINW